MWSPDTSAGVHSVKLCLHSPGASVDTLSEVPAGTLLTKGTEYVLVCTYSGTDIGYRSATYNKLVLVKDFKGATPGNTDVIAEVTPSVSQQDAGLTRTWYAMFKMPNPAGTPSIHVALMGTWSGGSITSAVRGFATTATYPAA